MTNPADNYSNHAPEISLEYHPWPPFIPDGAKVWLMGTFPPPKPRWSMDFFYPNRTNDFWYMMGLVFAGDKYRFYDREKKLFRLDEIKQLLIERGIALGDTGHAVRRLKGNASDKFLEIVEPVDFYGVLSCMPCCRHIATTGEKAAGVLADITSTSVPKVGESVKSTDGLTLWRMPSTSRAYPLAVEKKADYYRRLFLEAGVL